MFELYDAAAAHGSMIVGGEDPDVGLVGHLTGGGHSPISGTYGLAADNVLELEVVTPAGDIKTVNQCTNIDLFFASRGVRLYGVPAQYLSADRDFREAAQLSASFSPQPSKRIPCPQ